MYRELQVEEIQFIENYLQAQSLHYQPLQEELLDHMCCSVEDRLQEGIDFQQACEQVFQTFGKDEIQKMEKQTIYLIHQKSRIMTRLSLAFLLLLLGISTFLLAQMEPPSGLPLGKEFHVTANFGYRVHPLVKEPKLHKGIDFKAPIGTPIYATADGVVKTAKAHESGYGKHIIIQHDEAYQSLFAHLSEWLVEEGAIIKKGDLIGKVGSSGASTLPHLHYEVRKNGTAVDPAPYLKTP